MVELAEAGNVTPGHPDIRQRMECSPKARFTKHYVARHEGIEIGFVAVDVIPEADFLVLYELFILASFRGRGLGALVLTEVERFASHLEYPCITLYPSPLEPHFPVERLVAWYRRQGYSQRKESPLELEKRIAIDRQNPGLRQCRA
ncbi:GNAT family N-acetyltransferase [Bradyrhizobium sediminis]|uniref:GNAT family N-acetyltransferase n=1 Tax=Bradyrhizobium sediminis TaxID=2840469 RepID=A0A975RTL3_9BRAD|nr:GNAT family N-acetyltransferase [Bradyrhizobium sediminis]QWG19214.1 GNAT family N-acetyltransferase [Bradyrhizobium sediminis]